MGMVRRSDDVGRHRYQRGAVPAGTLVRVAGTAVIGMLWALCIAAGLSNTYTDPLAAYWGNLTPAQQEANCDTWSNYPRYTQNSMVGLVNYQVTAERAHEFLWKECNGKGS